MAIVSHGAQDLLRRCLRSLEGPQEQPPRSVTVIDSGSRDSTPEMVRREFPWVELIRRENIGFAAANNLVVSRRDSEFVLLLNPDTEVRPDTVSICLERMDADPSIGMIGCKLVLPSGEIDHACKRSFPTPASALGHFTGLGRRESAPHWLAQYRAPHLAEGDSGPVDAVNGAFMLVRSEAVRDVGLLDEGYWLYMEDLDWCFRFWTAGWKVFYEPRAVAQHVKGGSSDARRAPRLQIAFHRGMGRFYRKHEAPRTSPVLSLLVYAGIGAKLMASLLAGLGQRYRESRGA
ncbi:MAG TPA: glycosyltransferase family 2 protein [Solirubrobacterales bacterium]|nr:glycosyltransferase family 2 protein [Solirubrobacterales bacterium]